MKRILLLVALLAACGKSATAPSPAGLDPSVLVVNLSPDPVRIIFASDQSGIFTYDTVPVAAGATVCARWTQTFDSLYTKVIDTLPNVTGHYSTVSLPWLRFANYPYYFQIDTVLQAGGAITQHIVAQEC